MAANDPELYFGGFVDATGRVWVLCEGNDLIAFEELTEASKPTEGTAEYWNTVAENDCRIFAMLKKFVIPKLIDPDVGRLQFLELVREYNLGAFAEEIKARAKNDLSCMRDKDTYCPRCKEWAIWGNDRPMAFCPQCGSSTVCYTGEFRKPMFWKRCIELLHESRARMFNAETD